MLQRILLKRALVKEGILLLLRSFLIALCSSIVVSQKSVSSNFLVSQILFLISPVLFYIFLEEYHQAKKERVTATARGIEKGIKGLWQLVRDREFLFSALPPLVFLLLLAPRGMLWRALPVFLPAYPIVRQALGTLLSLGAVFFLFLLAERALRRDWHRHWKLHLFRQKEGRAEMEPLSKGRLVFNLAVTVVGLSIILTVWPLIIGFVALMFGVIFLSKKLTVLFFFVLFLIPVCRWVRILWQKWRFCHKMRRICRENGYLFQQMVRPFRGGYLFTGRVEFTVETPQEVFFGSFLPIHSLRAILYLYQGENRYQFEKRFFWWWIFYPKHRFSRERLTLQTKKPQTRVIVLTREPHTVCFGDRDTYRQVWCGDKLEDYTLQHADAFLHWVDRLSIIREGEKNPLRRPLSFD